MNAEVLMAASPYDYSDLLKVYLATGVVTHEPVVPPFNSVTRDQLADLSVYGYNDFVWWPGENTPPLAEYEKYDMSAPESLVADYARKVVIVTRPVLPWTAEEIEADIAPRRAQAIYDATRDADAFYNTVLTRRKWEQPVLDAAKEYRAANYTDTPPAAVNGFANVNGQTAQEAADAIVAIFDQTDEAVGTLFAKRAAHQAAIQASMVNSELNAAIAGWTAAYATACASALITPRYEY